MKNTRNIILLTISLLLIVFTLHLITDVTEEMSFNVNRVNNFDPSIIEDGIRMEVHDNVDIIRQTQLSRKEIGLNVEHIQTVYLDTLNGLNYSTNIKCLEGQIIAFDQDKKFKLFDTDFKHIRSIGKGVGRGPGEIHLGIDYSVFEDKVVTTCPVTMKVVAYSLVSDDFLEYNVRNATSGIMTHNKVLYSSFMNPYFIYTYNPATDEESGIFKLLKNQEQSLNALNSFTAYSVTYNKWCFAFLYVGYFLCIDTADETPKVAQTLNLSGYLPYKVLAIGGYTITSEFVVSSDISIYDNSIVLLSGFMTDRSGNEYTVLDFYNLDTMLYSGSMFVPGRFIRFHICENMLIAHDRQKNSLSLYSLVGYNPEHITKAYHK